MVLGAAGCSGNGCVVDLAVQIVLDVIEGMVEPV
jgi:hypothetical protein